MKVLFLVVLSMMPLISHGTQNVQDLLAKQECGFLQNKGQLADEQGNTLIDIKYYARQGGVYLYCRANKISFVFTKVKYEENIAEATGKANDDLGKQKAPKNAKIYTSRADMILIGANPNPAIIASEEQAYYENYYLAQTTMQGISNVYTYKTITYQNIYPHIDLVLHSWAQGIKYEYIVYPGGRVSDIQMQWYGLAQLSTTTCGGIKYDMRLDGDKVSMQESAPLSFTPQYKVASSFVKKGNRIGFSVGKYDHDETLTIDPELNWGTYFGGVGDEIASSIRNDNIGNVYIAGTTNSINGIASAGAYQSSINLLTDIFLVKFSSDGSFIWGTYYGGSNNDYAYALDIDALGDINIGGASQSQGIATSGAQQTTMKGVGNAILAQFNISGSLLWSTYYGGLRWDAINSIASDNSGNIFVTGTASSSTGLATQGAYESSFFNADEEAFVAKFGHSGKIVWGTYFGRNRGITYGQGISIDNAGNLYISGSTNNTIIASGGVYQSAYGGGLWDAYLAKFSRNGAFVWATYYGGGGVDYSNNLCCDGLGNIYITGYTTSAGLATAGTYQSSYFGMGYNAFLAKFNANGALLWATYFGADGNEIAQGICIYRDRYIYISGNTNSNNGIASKDASQDTINGLQDAFLAKFNADGSIVWSTYFGGEADDFGKDICLDSADNVFMTGYTLSTIDIATRRAYQNTIGGILLNDAFIAKFSSPHANNAGIDSILNPYGRRCAANEAVKVRLKNYGSRNLNSVKIGWTINGVIQKDYYWYGSLAPGASTSVTLGTVLFAGSSYTLAAYTSLPNGITDSVTANDTANSILVTYALTNNAWVIKDSGVNYYFRVQDSTNAPYYYLWLLDGTLFNTYSFTHTFTEKKEYTIKLITTNTYGCVNEHDTTINVIYNKPLPSKNNPYHIDIYPNPFKDKAAIYFSSEQHMQVSVSITDMMGRMVYNKTTEYYPPGYTNKIEINWQGKGLAAGTYLINIMVNDEIVMKKVVMIE